MFGRTDVMTQTRYPASRINRRDSSPRGPSASNRARSFAFAPRVTPRCMATMMAKRATTKKATSIVLLLAEETGDGHRDGRSCSSPSISVMRSIRARGGAATGGPRAIARRLPA
uniref:Uncharacterized protein n=1 Tax=Burkholderia orbicola (strain AU 1054) TaxID=331271 RepID=A0A0H2XVE5_BURO1